MNIPVTDGAHLKNSHLYPNGWRAYGPDEREIPWSAAGVETPFPFSVFKTANTQTAPSFNRRYKSLLYLKLYVQDARLCR